MEGELDKESRKASLAGWLASILSVQAGTYMSSPSIDSFDQFNRSINQLEEEEEELPIELCLHAVEALEDVALARTHKVG